MKRLTKAVLILLSVAAMSAGAQSPTNDQGVKQETQARGYWTGRWPIQARLES